MSKIKKVLILSIPISLVAPVSIVSCSKTFDDVDILSNISSWVNSNYLNVKIKTNQASKNLPITLFEDKTLLKNEVLFLDLNSSNLQNVEIEFQEEIKNSIKNVSIEYSHYLIPKLGQDGNSYIFFNIKYKNQSQQIKIKFNQFANDNQFGIANLNQQEINNLIKNKMLETTGLLPNLSFMISQYYEQNNELIQLPNNVVTISQTIQDNIRREIIKKVKYFDNENCFVTLKFNTSQQENQILKLSFLLWVSTDQQTTTNTSNGYEVEIPSNVTIKTTIL